MNREAAIPVEELVEELAPQRRFRPYPEYRESDIDGVCAVPAHWADKPLKYVAAVNANKFADTTDPDYELEYVDIGNVSLIEGVTSTETYHFEDAPSRARRRVQPGDTIISTVRTYLKAVARIDDPPENLVVSTGFAVLHAGPALDPAYLYRVVQSDAFVERVVAYSVGVSYPAINPSDLVALGIPVPPLNEQRAIAAFLDRETARIDELIAKKQRLIELLAEKRTALISHAVTKGLNPDAPMKDSGIDWLGDVPAHWAVLSARRVLRRIEQGWSPEADNRLANEDEWAVMRAGCVNSGEFNEDDHKALPSGMRPDHSLEIHAGDFLMSRACGSAELVGSVAIVRNCRSRRLLCDKLFRLHVRRDVADQEFVVTALSSRFVRFQLEGELSGAEGLARNIAQSSIRSLLLCVPPLAEQSRIVSVLREQCSRLKSLSDRVADGVSHLREYRSAVISAAVTGKIDVREEVTE